MRGLYREYGAFIFAGRKTRKAVWRISRRMRTSIHINEAVALRDLTIGPDGDKSLSMRISFFPDPVITRRIPEIRDGISHTLLLLHRLSRCRPSESIHTQRFVNRKP